MAKSIGRMFAEDMKNNFVDFGKTVAKKETWKSVGNGMKTMVNYSGKLGRSTGDGELSTDKPGKAVGHFVNWYVASMEGLLYTGALMPVLGEYAWAAFPATMITRMVHAGVSYYQARQEE
ncbi:MAG: hypothetical protein HZB68_05410 [Candidatus Aenigmarchaeota archaeon]|nr:hypothetical protein [Candidatus Aenigmarchaeota archaeon]